MHPDVQLRHASSSAAGLLDLPDELLARILADAADLENTKLDVTHYRYVTSERKGYPRLHSSPAGINRRLHRIVLPLGRTHLFLAKYADEDIEFVVDGKGKAVDHLDMHLRENHRVSTSPSISDGPTPCPPFTFRLFLPLRHLTTLRIACDFVFPRACSDALKSLTSLRTLALRIAPEVEDYEYSFDTQLDLDTLEFSLTRYDLPEVGRFYQMHAWLNRGVDGLRILDVDARLRPFPSWVHLDTLILRSDTTVRNGGQWFIQKLAELEAADLADCSRLRKLVLAVQAAEFFLYDGTGTFDELFANLENAPSIEELEIWFDVAFRCDDAGTIEAPGIKRLAVTEKRLPDPGDPRANLNGLDEFILVFPNLEYLTLTASWLVPPDVAADLRDDADPPTTLSIAYDAPQLAEQLVFLRDQTDVREFRYRRTREADWELRWTREGGCGTQFEVSRWWV